LRSFFLMSALLAVVGCAGSPVTSLPVPASVASTALDGRADVVQRGDGDEIGETFMLPPSSDSPRSGIVRGYDNNMWFGTFGQFGRVTERGKFDLFTQETGFPFLSGGLSRGPEGDKTLWYTVEEANGGGAAVAEVTTPSGETVERAMPLKIQVLWGIAAGPDKAMYAASYGSNMIARIPVDRGPIAGYHLPGPVPGRPLDITLGPDGAMWFTMAGAGSIGRFDTKTHAITYFPIATPDAGPILSFAGSIYFLAGYDNENDYVGKMTPAGQIAKITLPTWSNKARIEAMCIGPDGNLWVGGFGSLWSIAPSDSVSGPMQLPGITQGPSYLAAGADGNLWSLNEEPASVTVYLLHALSTSASRFNLTSGEGAPLTVTEKTPSGTIRATSRSARVAIVTSNGPGAFTVTAVGAGRTTVHVSDAQHNFVDIPVTVSS
jgi:virginiamycin B lyase